MPKGFHVKDGLYFNRLENGYVVVTVDCCAHDGSTTIRTFEIDVDGFASVVASMSARGEQANGFYEAKEFLTRAPKE